MKKTKLSIQKFEIAKLKNPSLFTGGTGADDGGVTTGNTNTEEEKEKKKCAWGSFIEIPDNSLVKG